MSGTMSDFLRYDAAKAETRAARAWHDAASARLEVAVIKERLMEIRSQHEPLASLPERFSSDRERAFAAAFYVVVGRLPDAVDAVIS